MIIKFRENDSWVIFGEIDHIVYKEAFTVDEEKGSDDKALFFLADKDDKEAHKMRVEFFTKNMTEATVIFAYSPIYLMNDEGRTVETF